MAYQGSGKRQLPICVRGCRLATDEEGVEVLTDRRQITPQRRREPFFTPPWTTVTFLRFKEFIKVTKKELSFRATYLLMVEEPLPKWGLVGCHYWGALIRHTVEHVHKSILDFSNFLHLPLIPDENHDHAAVVSAEKNPKPKLTTPQTFPILLSLE